VGSDHRACNWGFIREGLRTLKLILSITCGGGKKGEGDQIQNPDGSELPRNKITGVLGRIGVTQSTGGGKNINGGKTQNF